MGLAASQDLERPAAVEEPIARGATAEILGLIAGFGTNFAAVPIIRVAYPQRSLVEVLLADSEKLWDPVLRRIDAELEDEGCST